MAYTYITEVDYKAGVFVLKKCRPSANPKYLVVVKQEEFHGTPSQHAEAVARCELKGMHIRIRTK